MRRVRAITRLEMWRRRGLLLAALVLSACGVAPTQDARQPAAQMVAPSAAPPTATAPPAEVKPTLARASMYFVESST